MRSVLLRLSSLARACVAASLWLLSPAVLVAQCPTGWDVALGTPGTDDTVFAATSWDPDGAGPLPARLVIGGRFTTAGGIAASRIAQWDPATGAWSALGSGVNNYVLCLATLPNGDLVAGGGFWQAGGVAASRIARWNGTTWSAFGGVAEALGADVLSLTVLSDGTLVAGGAFAFAGFTLVNYLARWNGATWLPFGTGMNNHVHATAQLANGDVVAAGYFTTAGGVPTNRIARWNGASWVSLGAGVDGPVFALANLPNGDLAVGGNFQNAGAGPAARLARWSPAGGGAWAPLGVGVNREVSALLVLPGGDLVAGGQFTTTGTLPANYIVRWNGTTWVSVGIGVDTFVRALALAPGGGFVVGGYFTTAGGAPVANLARACGNANWAALGTGCAGTGGVPTLSLVSPPAIGGTFTLALQNLGSGIPLMVIGLAPVQVSLVQLGFGFGFGCTLHAAIDELQVLSAVGGSATWSAPVPNDPALAGVHLWTQGIELGAVSAASNGGVGELR